MPRRKKKFIDKKNAITYHLIHRSQKDPLQADADASQMVLVTGDQLAEANRKEKLNTMGIYYDDDYDYEQHIRDVDDLNLVQPDRDVDLFRVGKTATSQAVLPAEVLPSAKEEKVGLLELAAPVSGPRLDWDPDVVAALDSDNEDMLDEEFDDDFVAMANKSDGEMDANDEDMPDRQRQWIEEQYVGGHAQGIAQAQVGVEDDENSDFSSNFDEEGDELGSLQGFSDDETKTRFTNYSMSSSVIRRNEGLTRVDDKFEQLYAEYDDEEIGALDHEDIDGKVSTGGPMMEYLLKQFEKQQVKEDFSTTDELKHTIEIGSDEESSEGEELTKVVLDEGVANKWDCESILSTYSNLYNHPKVIEEPWKNRKTKKIELTKKLGIPVESLAPTGLTRKQLEVLDKQNDGPSQQQAPVRRKGETPEEKRWRKAQVKEERKERRVEKKNTKLAFRHEEATQRKQQISTAVNLQGHKIV